MQCTTCSGETKVVSTAHVRTDLTKRRRECLRCGGEDHQLRKTGETPRRGSAGHGGRPAGEGSRPAEIDEILLKLHQAAQCLEEME